MYRIKQTLEDFKVWEMPDYELDEEGTYAYFWLKKKNRNTIDSIKKIALKLDIPLKNIGFAGNKDKVAVTEQVISIRAIKKERINSLRLNDIELSYIGQGNKPISLGDLKGNRFKITVSTDKRKILKPTDKIPNFFGPQRFSKNNIEIGKAMVQKNFRKAADLIDQRSVKDYINNNPGDPVGAIRQLPLRLRKMLTHSYQSYLWNKTVEEYLETKPIKNEKIPIVGFGITFKNDRISKIIRKLLVTEGITPRDFIIPQMPEISSEGGERDMFIKPEDMKIYQEQDKAYVSFTLPKSGYATVIIDYLFS